MTARTVRLGILAGIVGPIASWVLGLVVIASWPGYDPVSQSISLLATAPLGWLETAGFAIAGLLGLAWALALPQVLGAPATARGQSVGSHDRAVGSHDRALVRGLLLLQAVIALGFAVLPTDPKGAPVSTVGRLHLFDFYAYAVTMPLTLLALGLVMRRDPRWHGSARPTLLAATLAIVSIAVVPATIAGPLTPWLGLLERVFVAIPSIWQVGAALVAWRLAGSGVGLAPPGQGAVVTERPPAPAAPAAPGPPR